jgi:hypothetical protein
MVLSSETVMKIRFHLLLLIVLGLLTDMVCLGDGYHVLDYGTNRVNNPLWPNGLAELVNRTNRVEGHRCSLTDTFFFQGGCTDFSAFLQEYSKIQGIKRHAMVVIRKKDAENWEQLKTTQPWDWCMSSYPESWLTNFLHDDKTETDAAAEWKRENEDTNFIVEVDIFNSAKFPLKKVNVPENIRVIREDQVRR